jgi:hypothetical protein
MPEAKAANILGSASAWSRVAIRPSATRTAAKRIEECINFGGFSIEFNQQMGWNEPFMGCDNPFIQKIKKQSPLQ